MSNSTEIKDSAFTSYADLRGLKKLIVKELSLGAIPNIERIEKAVDRFKVERIKNEIKASKVDGLVLGLCDCMYFELLSKKRNPNIVFARVLITWYREKYCFQNESELGFILNKDRCSVLHYRKIHKQLTDERFGDKEYKEIFKNLKQGINDLSKPNERKESA